MLDTLLQIFFVIAAVGAIVILIYALMNDDYYDLDE